jgi:hypothetical protein
MGRRFGPAVRERYRVVVFVEIALGHFYSVAEAEDGCIEGLSDRQATKRAQGDL